MLIRDAVKEDFSRITEIYSDIVLHSTAIFRETPITVEDALSLWKSRLEARSPTIVALRFQARGSLRTGRLQIQQVPGPHLRSAIDKL